MDKKNDDAVAKISDPYWLYGRIVHLEESLGVLFRGHFNTEEKRQELCKAMKEAYDLVNIEMSLPEYPADACETILDGIREGRLHLAFVVAHHGESIPPKNADPGDV